MDLSEILSSLDSDTRNYLVLLLSAGAQAFHDPGASGTRRARRRWPTCGARSSALSPWIATPSRSPPCWPRARRNIRRAIHNLNLVTNAFGGVEGQLASLIRASDTNFSAIAANDTQLEQTLTEFPPTLQQSIETLNKVRGFATASTTTLTQLQPFARNLGPALKASRPLFRDTTPVIANQLRPFSVAVQPLARTLAAGAPKLKATIPALSSSIAVLNTLFNELAHKPGGGQQSYLFWGAWLAHIADSLVSSQDANGAVLQGLFMGTCDRAELLREPAGAQQPGPGRDPRPAQRPRAADAARRHHDSPARPP